MVQASYQRPLEQLTEALQRFARLREVRVLCVEVDARLRSGALQVVLAAEHLAGNTSPLVCVGVSYPTDSDAAWEAATDALRTDHGQRREAGSPMAGLAQRPFSAAGSATFAAQILQCVGSVRSPAQGLLLVLAAAGTSPSLAWLARVGEFIKSHRLQDARFVVLVDASDHTAAWLAKLDKGTFMHEQCVVDDAQLLDELTQAVETEERLGPGYQGAWPRGVRPPPLPRRAAFSAISQPAPPSSQADAPAPTNASSNSGGPTAPDADASDLTVALDPDTRIRLHVQRAAIASAKNDGPTCIREQAAARDLCLQQDRVREAITMELILGSYLAKLGQHHLAVATFDGSAKRAREHELLDLAAQGHLASGSTSGSIGDTTSALAAQREAIEAGRTGNHPGLAFQAYWEAGQIALRLGLEIDCIALWSDAYVYARELDPEQLKGNRAKDVLEHLAQLLARYRRYSEAREVERLAQTLT